MRTTWVALVVAILAPSVRADCEFKAQRSSVETAQGLTQLVLVTGAGGLTVRGSAAARSIEATGLACSSSREQLDQVVITTRREGATLYVDAVAPNSGSELKLATLDLSITVPDSLHVDAQDSSGDATFENLGSARIFDSSGNLRVRRISGALDLTDSSGDIDVDQVGSIVLRDSSGDIRLERVSGSVEIVSDSSGDMDIRAVGGSVHIVQDSSGDIAIADVKGNATVDADSSGSIRVNDIGGDFVVLADSSGGITHRRVRGRISLP
jgi:Putative adhesin